MSTALELSGLWKSFGGLIAAGDVSLRLETGARHALIGPNGAGKTTLVNLITDQLRPDAGRIVLDGQDITRLPAHRRVRAGLVRNFQLTNLFGSFSARENIALAVAERMRLGLSLRSASGFSREVLEEADAIAARTRLAGTDERPVHELAYGQQRLVEFALAMALRPRVLLLDEPASGLPAADHAVILEVLTELPADVAVLLIEHDIPLVFRFARSVTVLSEGRVLVSGAPEAIRADPRVRAAYLGSRHG
jgi:branched-chain amino acid transport system ATP-binding protein